MKLPKFDFSKEGLSRFFLHHVEKLILALAVILLGVFVFLGMGTKVYSDKEPDVLKKDAQVAHNYIVKDDSWSKISENRQADDTVHKKIEDASEPIDPNSYVYASSLVGTPVKTLNPRKDPDLVRPTELAATSFKAALLLRLSENDQTPEYVGLPLASESDDEESGKGGGDDGPGGFGGFSGGDDEKKKKKKKDEGFKIGTKVSGLQKLEMPGMRPIAANLKAAQNYSKTFNIVLLTALYEHRQQWQMYEHLKDAKAFYLRRDKPNYKHLEVQRREINGDEEGEWENVSSQMLTFEDVKYSDKGSFVGAPEVIHPDYFDRVLTRPIPPITQMDYRDVSVHLGSKANIPLRDLDPEVEEVVEEKPKTLEEQMRDAKSGGAKKDNKKAGNGGRNGRGQAGNDSKKAERDKEIDYSSDEDYVAAMNAKQADSDYKLIRFYDCFAKPGKTYKYRIRVWVSDPNNEDPEGFASDDKKRSGRGDNQAVGIGATGDGSGGTNNKKDRDAADWGEEVKVSVEDNDIAVRQRIEKESNREDRPDDVEGLQYARATDWLELKGTVTVGNPVGHRGVIAGAVTPPRPIKIDDKLYSIGEKKARIVAKTWDVTVSNEDDEEEQKSFGSAVPGTKEVYRGDVVNFKVDSHFLHPISWTVLKVKNAFLKTDALVVDILGGEDVKALGGNRYSMKYALPGEILLLDVNEMTFRVRNELDDRREFMHSLFLADEKAVEGRERKRKKKDEDEQRGGGGSFNTP